MQPLTFEEARECVIAQVRASSPKPEREKVGLELAWQRVLGDDAIADRDSPVCDRSIRDGFAVRAADTPGVLRVIGEARAGGIFDGEVGPSESVEIMTGAALPVGTDAVVMVEHTSRNGDLVILDEPAEPGQFVLRKGSEMRMGDRVLAPGLRIQYPQISLLATLGYAHVSVFRKPSVAILATGDELVEVAQTPLPYQIRNSNTFSLACQVERAGGVPRVLPVARDEAGHTRRLIEQGLQNDLLLLSGGVSAGKYDLVEAVLGELGSEVYFDRVRIQPGQPLVFGRAKGTFWFGLPGNPVSTMVTFELFGRAALELLCGDEDLALPYRHLRLSAPFRHKTGLTRFLPAIVEGGMGGETATVAPVLWQGSSDIAAVSRANCWLVADAEREAWNKGDWMKVLPV